MLELNWTVEMSCEIDVDELTQRVKKLIEKTDYNDEETINDICFDVIRDDIASYDDDIYYNFGDEQYEIVAEAIRKKIQVQQKLF